MTYNTKNYKEQGGDKWVIGGSLEFKEGAELIGLPPSDFPKLDNQEVSTAEDLETLREDFNSLLLKLKVVGLMANED